MSNDWSFRDEILKATQRWPWLILICVAGSLIGWAISLGWPTPHRATKELYVGLNVYPSLENQAISEYAGIQVINANDFKNWQMASLNNLILMDSVMDDTLLRLQQMDSYWDSVSRADLSSSLHVYWRNAGKWRLVVENQDPNRAVQAVDVWQDVVLEKVHSAVLESQQALVLEFQLRALADNRAHLLARSHAIQRANNALKDWQVRLGSRSPDSALGPSEHWQIWRLITTTDLDTSWEPLLETFPAVGAPVKDYLDWVDQAAPRFNEEISLINQQISDLKVQEQQSASLFARSSQKSLGLSATLDVDKISDSRTQQTVTRPTGVLMLAGGLFGLIAWLFYWFSVISLRGSA